MYWNCRVVKFEDDWFEICEVYYDDNGKPIMQTEKGVSVCGENIEQLRVTLERMLECLDKPILDEIK